VGATYYCFDSFDWEDNLLFKSSITRSVILFISLGNSIFLYKRLFNQVLRLMIGMYRCKDTKYFNHEVALAGNFEETVSYSIEKK
jgi:hypothetical protein